MSRRMTFLLGFTVLFLGTSAKAQTTTSLDELLKEYQAHGLPLPPKDRKLVQFDSGIRVYSNGKGEPRYLLAFEIKPGTKTEKPILLSGLTQVQPTWNPRCREVAAEPEAARDLELSADDDLVLAIQCHMRGWDKLARFLLERSQKEATLPLRKQLVQLAWSYWERQLTQPGVDRAPVAKRLKELIRQDKEFDTNYNRSLLKSLDLALLPSKAKPGSVKAMIDDLVDYDADSGPSSQIDPGDRYERLVKLGFEAVPELIKHLNDDRLTRAKSMGHPFVGNSWHLRVGEVVGNLLDDLAVQDLMRAGDEYDSRSDSYYRQLGYRVTVKSASEWWEKAQKVGEEQYLLDHVLSEGEVNSHLLTVIEAKYPKHVSSLYRKVLDQRPKVDSWMLAEALLRCKVPDKEKLTLLRHAGKHKDNKHRLPALRMLKDLDRKQFSALLLATIESIPPDVAGLYWSCPEAGIARLAIESEDPRVWPTLENVARRSVLGLRMELLHRLGDPEDTRHRSERLRLLAGFLNDSTMRDVESNKKFMGPGAGFPYAKIEVRDFVALEIARLLGMDIERNLERTREEWVTIRSQVQKSLKRELDKNN